MSAALVAEAETWPAPPRGVFPLSLVSDDGETARMYEPTCAEVTLCGPRDEERRQVVVSIAFPSLERAERAGNILEDAFTAVRKILAEDPPDQETCAHQPRVHRFARDLKKTSVCDLCCANLGETEL